eukprot:7381772-Prymnesium_polylepis.1
MAPPKISIAPPFGARHRSKEHVPRSTIEPNPQHSAPPPLGEALSESPGVVVSHPRKAQPVITAPPAWVAEQPSKQQSLRLSSRNCAKAVADCDVGAVVLDTNNAPPTIEVGKIQKD